MKFGFQIRQTMLYNLVGKLLVNPKSLTTLRITVHWFHWHGVLNFATSTPLELKFKKAWLPKKGPSLPLKSNYVIWVAQSGCGMGGIHPGHPCIIHG